VTALTLNRLTRSEIAQMVGNVAGEKRLPESIKSDIVERAGGVPLFAEEITKAMLEAMDEGAAPACALAGGVSPVPALPASLHASLLARLDRLGTRDIVQMAAAIGQEFSHTLLAHVAQKSEGELDAALDRLVQAGLLIRHGIAPEATYVFKHSLCQDAAYGTLLREPKLALHARIAEAMEYQSPDLASTEPEVLARHYTLAGITEKAALFWARAGRHSLARSALVEAEPQLQRALTLIADLPGSSAVRKFQNELRAELGNVKAQRDAVLPDSGFA
jgi:predicted ATPase